MEKVSYVGKKVYVGIDVHKKNYKVYCICEGLRVKNWSSVADAERLAEQLSRYFAGAQIQSGYEAGFSGFVLHRVLERKGITNYVINASSIQVSSRDRVKTDKRDAQKIAEHLSKGMVTSIRIPSEAEEKRRLLSRVREDIVGQITCLKNMSRMKLHQFGLIDASDDRGMSRKIVKAIMEQIKDSNKELNIVLQSFLDIWEAWSRKLIELKKELKKQAESDKLELIYRSVPGVGEVTSRILSNELGDMSQFRNERQLFSYTGLTPSESSSGEKVKKGHISRQGNSRVRHVLVEIAWRVIKIDEVLATSFGQIAARAGKKKAIVAIARRIIGRMRALFRNNCSAYQIDFVKV